MSKANVEYDLENSLRMKGGVFVLFFASWCPFSRRFLPVFEKFSQGTSRNCMSILIDDKASLCERYAIHVYPTVILFDEGKVVRRLDGVLGVGLTEEQLMSFSHTS
jgi:thioredoxin-like negative regulator of GroEL